MSEALQTSSQDIFTHKNTYLWHRMWLSGLIQVLEDLHTYILPVDLLYMYVKKIESLMPHTHTDM